MLEIELTFTNLIEIMNLAEKLIKYIISYILKNNINELKYLENFNNKQIILNIKNFLQQKFEIISYTNAINLIKKNKKNIE